MLYSLYLLFNRSLISSFRLKYSGSFEISQIYFAQNVVWHDLMSTVLKYFLPRNEKNGRSTDAIQTHGWWTLPSLAQRCSFLNFPFLIESVDRSMLSLCSGLKYCLLSFQYSSKADSSIFKSRIFVKIFDITWSSESLIRDFLWLFLLRIRLSCFGSLFCLRMYYLFWSNKRWTPNSVRRNREITCSPVFMLLNPTFLGNMIPCRSKISNTSVYLILYFLKSLSHAFEWILAQPSLYRWLNLNIFCIKYSQLLITLHLFSPWKSGSWARILFKVIDIFMFVNAMLWDVSHRKCDHDFQKVKEKFQKDK